MLCAEFEFGPLRAFVVLLPCRRRGNDETLSLSDLGHGMEMPPGSHPGLLER